MNLNQVTVGCTDVAASVAFYEKLGLKLIVLDRHYARFECPQGDATFSVHRADELVPGAGPLNRICLYHAGKNRKSPPWRIER